MFFRRTQRTNEEDSTQTQGSSQAHEEHCLNSKKKT